MQRVAMDSSSLAGAGYDREGQVMEVEFRSGGIYRYLAVPPSVFAEFEAAESKGRFVNVRIKPAFECVEVRRARR